MYFRPALGLNNPTFHARSADLGLTLKNISVGIVRGKKQHKATAPYARESRATVPVQSYGTIPLLYVEKEVKQRLTPGFCSRFFFVMQHQH